MVKTIERKNRTIIGWQGITVETPDDWGLAAFSGDSEKGYLRADSPISTSVEIRWAAAKSAPDLAARADEFLSLMKKTSRKRKTKFTSKIEAKKDAEPGTPVKFTWKSDRNGYGKLIYCPDCGRVVIAQVVTPSDNNCTSMAFGVVDSIRDHSEPGWRDWSIFGIRAAVPEEFHLEKQTLLSAYTLLRFKGRSGELTIEQWGLAENLLKKYSLEEWYRKDSLAQVKGFKTALETIDEPGHMAMRISGQKIGLVNNIKAIAKSITLRPLPVKLSGYVWHCPEVNRLFSVRLVNNNAALIESIRERMFCHEDLL
ncbi:MAG: hypothetical protein ABFD46_02240 [Armatimonadota bacterium]